MRNNKIRIKVKTKKMKRRCRKTLQKEFFNKSSFIAIIRKDNLKILRRVQEIEFYQTTKR
jgi:hypothetical protein